MKYILKKSADGTIFKVSLATLVLFNLAYFIAQSTSQYAIDEKINFNFFKDITDPKTYLYIIASSVILAVLISSFIFYKIKTKELSYSDKKLFDEKIKELSLVNSEKNKIEKVTIGLDPNCVMIMPNQNVIEIPVLHYDTTDKKLEDNDNLFKEVSFNGPPFCSNKNNSIYPAAINLEEFDATVKKIVESKIYFFKYSDFKRYCKYPVIVNGSVMLEHNIMTEITKDKTISPMMIHPTESFKFTDLYNINSIKFHYADCLPTKVKLDLKEERSANIDLCKYVMANRHNMQNTILEEPYVAFIPAIAGNRPIFDGKVLQL